MSARKPKQKTLGSMQSEQQSRYNYFLAKGMEDRLVREYKEAEKNLREHITKNLNK